MSNKELIKYASIFVAVVALPFPLIVAFQDITGPSIAEGLLQYYYDQSYSGVVVETYVDWDNHAYEVILLNSEERVVLPSGYGHLFQEINPGDSLHKGPNSFYGLLVLGEDTIHMNYATWIWHNLMEEKEREEILAELESRKNKE
ncbi:hypothetical protein [Lewinella sp. W8]|uniref:hypothetical protein n=1 Tax=Lewinella sp. W8 TaxID=2528208 RepID=UPI001068509E|nr:hypothetical protein [Lewinella sp. W8]MTB50896.1 hypothetical protein [Lewinella sp. W8]